MKLIGFICLIFLAGAGAGWVSHSYQNKKSTRTEKHPTLRPAITAEIATDPDNQPMFNAKRQINSQIYVNNVAQFDPQVGSVPLNLAKETGGRELSEDTDARHRLGRIALDKKTMVYLDFIEDKIHFPSTYELRESFTQKLLISFEVFNKESAVFYFPGNGTFYLKQAHLGLCGSRFLRKFNLQKDRIIEQKQAFYFIGEETKVLEPTPLFEHEDSKKVVAHLTPDSEVTVIGVSTKTALDTAGNLLVKSPLGLVGWHRSYEEKSGSLLIYQCN